MKYGADSIKYGADSMKYGTDSMKYGTDSMKYGTDNNYHPDNTLKYNPMVGDIGPSRGDYKPSAFTKYTRENGFGSQDPADYDAAYQQ